MAKVKTSTSGTIEFMCPGCNTEHNINSSWTFNGDVDKPTFNPSVLVRTGHYASSHKGDCWCTFNEEHKDDPTSYKCSICHSFVRDGKIQFLDDCTHALKGQTVDLPEIKVSDTNAKT